MYTLESTARYQYCSPTNKTRAKQHCFASCSIDYLPSALCTYLLLPELLSNLHCPVAPFRFVSALRHGSANTSITVQSLHHLFFFVVVNDGTLRVRQLECNTIQTQKFRNELWLPFFGRFFFCLREKLTFDGKPLESNFQASWFNLLRYLRRFNFF